MTEKIFYTFYAFYYFFIVWEFGKYRYGREIFDSFFSMLENKSSFFSSHSSWFIRFK